MQTASLRKGETMALVTAPVVLSVAVGGVVGGCVRVVAGA